MKKQTSCLPSRLQAFVEGISSAITSCADEPTLLATAKPLLQALMQHDDWLPDAYAQPHPDHYQQFLLYKDPGHRFSVVSFVWGPGQGTPIHDHTVWGLIGVLRGAEDTQSYRQNHLGQWLPDGDVKHMRCGEVDTVSPTIGDVHRVRNALSKAVSISIHVYGADIGQVQRHTYLEDGSLRPFVSGYANAAS